MAISLECVEPLAVAGEEKRGVANELREVRGQFGPWLTTRDCVIFIPCKTLGGAYAWLKRHGIRRRSNGSVAKRDLERVLNQPRRRRRMVPAQLDNLRQRRTA